MVYVKIIFFLTPLFATQTVVAQQRLKPLMERVALLQIYIKLAEDGYRNLKKGWSTVQAITRGEWDLHAAFFDGLQRVPESVTESAAVIKVQQDQQIMLRLFRKLMPLINKNSVFREDEKMYFRKVVQGLMDQAATDLQLFNGLLLNGHFSMAEAERLKMIQGLQISIAKIKVTMNAFYTDLQAVSKMREANLNELQKYYR